MCAVCRFRSGQLAALLDDAVPLAPRAGFGSRARLARATQICRCILRLSARVGRAGFGSRARLAKRLRFVDASCTFPLASGERVTFLCSCKEKSPKESTLGHAPGYAHALFGKAAHNSTKSVCAHRARQAHRTRQAQQARQVSFAILNPKNCEWNFNRSPRLCEGSSGNARAKEGNPRREAARKACSVTCARE